MDSNSLNLLYGFSAIVSISLVICIYYVTYAILKLLKVQKTNMELLAIIAIKNGGDVDKIESMINTALRDETANSSRMMQGFGEKS